MQKNKHDFCLTECIIIIIFTLIMILNFELVVNAEELPTITPVWNNEHTTADNIINFVNTEYDYDVVTTNYLIIYDGGNTWYDWFNVYATPIPTENGDFLGSPLSLSYNGSRFNINLGTYTEIFRVKYVHNESENDYGTYYFASTPDLYFTDVNRVFANTQRNIYYIDTENIAIIGQIQGGPDSSFTGHPVKPSFYDDENKPEIPDTDNITDNNLLKIIANGILDLGNKVKNGFNNMYDNIKDFTQPYYDEFLKHYNNFRDSLDYIKQPLDNEQIKNKINNLSIMQDINTISVNVDNLKNIISGATPKNDRNAKFIIDFSPVEMFNTGQVVVDFSFYSSIRTICNAFILMSVIISFILYILKALPDIIRGASADDK